MPFLTSSKPQCCWPLPTQLHEKESLHTFFEQIHDQTLDKLDIIPSSQLCEQSRLDLLSYNTNKLPAKSQILGVKSPYSTSILPKSHTLTHTCDILTHRPARALLEQKYELRINQTPTEKDSKWPAGERMARVLQYSMGEVVALDQGLSFGENLW